MEPVTAVDYLKKQEELENEARELMPFEPDLCTYPQVLRQQIYACLTCLRQHAGGSVGVCYSCSIQCHLTHELAELFTKRDFTCDCGTSRMSKGDACSLRQRAARSGTGTSSIIQRNSEHHQRPGGLPQMASSSSANHKTGLSASSFATIPQTSVSQASSSEIPRMRTGLFSHSHFKPTLDLGPAEDVPGSENSYNHNFQGRFCSCGMIYNPVRETRVMHQCYLGDKCGEDWFHQDCILGYRPGLFHKEPEGAGVNRLDDLPSPGAEAAEDHRTTVTLPDVEDEVVHFPELEGFSEFICWQCVEAHREAFDELAELRNVVFTTRPHLHDITSADEWRKQADALNEADPPAKRGPGARRTSFSVFLMDNFKGPLKEITESLSEGLSLAKLLRQFPFLVDEDKVYEPPVDDNGSTNSSTGSLYELGSNALRSLPAPQAIEGLHAYGMMKAKLKDFFKDFVDLDKVVTEKEVRDFFTDMTNELKSGK